MTHLFLSHSSANDGFVRELRAALADLAQEVWIDSRQLRGGDPLWSEIQSAMEGACGLAVLVSPKALESRWVGKELRHGLQLQKERGRDAFPVIPLSLDGTKLGVLEEFFDEEPTYIPVSSGAGGAEAALDAILVALGKRLPADQAPVPQPPAELVEELVLELTDLTFHEQDGVRRAAANAQLIYEPAMAGARAVESQRWRLIAPLGPIEAEELRWYLERWPVWPNPVVADRARQVEANLIAWGQALHGVALPPAHTAAVLQAWGAVAERASRRFSVSVDPSLVAGASAVETTAAQEAATALLALPWELLHNGDGFLFQGARPTRVRRRLPNTRPLPVPVVAPPIRVLLITARPEDEACGYLDHRASALPLVEATEQLGERMRLTQLHPPTFAALEAELQRAQAAGRPYHVVHFDGHGVYDRRVGLGGLCFEDPRDGEKLSGRRHDTVTTDRLGPLLTNYRIPLVVLEACQSATAEAGGESVASELLQRGVASVVAMSHSVLVETAQRFVAAFYGELARGQRVGQAMLAGQRALHSDPSRGERYGIGELRLADWFVPVLYQEKADPQLFQALHSPQTVEDQAARLRARLGAVPKAPVGTGFVGRSRELLALERLLRQRRWAVVRGQGGEGKTALAAELARWLVHSQQLRRAAFVSVEICGHSEALLDALGKQLVGPEYSVAKFEHQEQALLPIERALREQPTVLVIDNMESVLLPPYLEASELLSAEAAEELAAILGLGERLLAGETRILFTSREALPAPFAAPGQLLELRQLAKADAVALVERALAAGDVPGAPDGGAGGALPAQREEIEDLVEAVAGHARTLALLGPELRRRGVAGTREALVALMAQMERQFPGNREQSLFASVELSLRRLSAENRQRARVLGVFHGGVHLGMLRVMTGWGVADVESLANELVTVGLATMNSSCYHLSLTPALCPYLSCHLDGLERETLRAQWFEAMRSYVGSLENQRFQNAELVSLLSFKELPNLFAALEFTRQHGSLEMVIDLVSILSGLLANLGRPGLLERLQHFQPVINYESASCWSRALFQSWGNSIEGLRQKGELSKAIQSATLRHQRASIEGESAYVHASYDLAYSAYVLAQLLRISGRADQALTLLRESRQKFEAFARDSPGLGAERMSAVCLTEEGICLSMLGRLDEAAAAHEEGIHLARQRGDQRQGALCAYELGVVRQSQGRFPEALTACDEARSQFVRLNEPGSVAMCWSLSGWIYLQLAQPDAAEEAFNKSLTIDVQLGDRSGQADTLMKLGILYAKLLRRPEDALVFYRRAAEVFCSIGDNAGEAKAWGNLAEALRQTHRLSEARQAIHKSLTCTELDHAFQAWALWSILSEVERDGGNLFAAMEARSQAIAAFLAYRRDGGESQSPAGQLALAVRQHLGAGGPAKAASLLQPLAADPGWAQAHPYLSALQAIAAGSRERSLAEDPALSYDQAAEALLLIEVLEQGERGS